MISAVAVRHWPHDALSTEVRRVRGIFAIGPYRRTLVSKTYRLGVEGPERPTMTITGRHGIRNEATESRSATSGAVQMQPRRGGWSGACGIEDSMMELCRCDGGRWNE
ncbi:unnamed protein product [Penicillium camemberti]|uniref:Str. FM013 n=1 Tax=Penicillium camemberti (strain FM 013) TaxID=1429867 RepID=A0A0G4PMJ1_PENC3|nr:unnamed protein product [Penicillium camemberti]